MALPNLAALNLGPPTGPIVVWERAFRKTRAQTIKNEKCEGKAQCPISQEELIANEEYYSFPGYEGKTAYEIPKLYAYFVHEASHNRPMKNPFDDKQEVPPEDWRAIKKWMQDHHPDLVVPGMEYDTDGDDFDDDFHDDDPPSPPSASIPPQLQYIEASELESRLGSEDGVSIGVLANSLTEWGALRALTIEARRRLGRSGGREWMRIVYFTPASDHKLRCYWNESRGFAITATVMAESAMGRMLSHDSMPQGEDNSRYLNVYDSFGNRLTMAQVFLSALVGGAMHLPVAQLAAQLTDADYTFSMERFDGHDRSGPLAFYVLKVTIGTQFMSTIYRNEEHLFSPAPIDPSPIWVWPPAEQRAQQGRSPENRHWQGLKKGLERMVKALNGLIEKTVIQNESQQLIVFKEGDMGNADLDPVVTMMRSAVESTHGTISAEAPLYYAIAYRE
jgi:hypothetical protein